MSVTIKLHCTHCLFTLLLQKCWLIRKSEQTLTHCQKEEVFIWHFVTESCSRGEGGEGCCTIPVGHTRGRGRMRVYKCTGTLLFIDGWQIEKARSWHNHNHQHQILPGHRDFFHIRCNYLKWLLDSSSKVIMTTSQQAEDRRQARCMGNKWTLLASVVDL